MDLTTISIRSHIANATEGLTNVSGNGTLSDGFAGQDNGTLTDNLNQINSPYAIAETPLATQTYILFCLTAFVSILGLFGNALILTVIFKGRSGPLKAHDMLISALAVCDAIALTTTALSQPSVADVIGIDIRAISIVGCKVFMGIFSAAAISSVAVVALICIERFVAVWYPLRARYILSRAFILRCLLTNVGVIIIVFVSMSVLYSEIEDGICDPNFAGKIYSTVLKRFPTTTFYIATLGFTLLIYFIILFTLTPMILVKLYKQRLVRRQLTATEQDNGNFRTTIKLMAVVVVFLIFVALPNGIGIAIGLSGTRLNDTSKTGDLLSWLSLTFLLNYSTNFLLYSMFDSQFRNIALKLLGFTKDEDPNLVKVVSLKADEQAETCFTH